MQATGAISNAFGYRRQAQISGDTAELNAAIRAREMAGEAQMLDREAQVADIAAVSERQATKAEVERFGQQAKAFQHEQRAAVGASGLEATGSPLLVLSETAKQLELDRLAIAHAGELRAREAEDAGRMSRYSAARVREGIPFTREVGRYTARAARDAGRMGMIKSLLSGGTSLISNYALSRGITGSTT